MLSMRYKHVYMTMHNLIETSLHFNDAINLKNDIEMIHFCFLKQSQLLYLISGSHVYRVSGIAQWEIAGLATS